MTKYLESLNAKAMKLAGEYCELYNSGTAKSKELKAAKKAANSAMDDYNLELSKEQYLEWNKSGHPVELAIRSLVIPGALKISFKETDDVMGFSVKDTQYFIDLLMMEVVLGGNVFADRKWFNAMEKLCSLTINHLAERSCRGKAFQYQVEDASKAFDFPEGINPISDEGVILALQQVFDKVLFIENPEKPGENLIHTTTGVDSLGNTFSNEWTIIRESMTYAAGVNEVAVCNTAHFSRYVANAMHGILTNGKFGLVAEEYTSRSDIKQNHINSELKKPGAEPPKAESVPETHKPAKEKTAKTTTKKKTAKKATTKKATTKK